MQGRLITSPADSNFVPVYWIRGIRLISLLHFQRFFLLCTIVILVFCMSASANTLVAREPTAVIRQGSFITLDPIGTHYTGEKITITGTTDLPAGSQVLFQVMAAGASPNVQSPALQYSGATGTATVSPGKEGNYNRLSFDLDLSTFQVGDYHVTATGVNSAVSGAGEFWVVSSSGQKEKPVPAFTWSPQPALVGQPVWFDGTGSSSPGGKILSWQWDFGDGTPLTPRTGSGADARPSHTYRTAGTYSVGLRVMDTTEQTAWAWHDIAVVVPVPPVADFSVSPAEGYAWEGHSFSVTVDDHSKGSPATYAWYIDKTLVSGLPTYSRAVFSTPGNYTIRLLVTNEFGTSEASHLVTVRRFESTTSKGPSPGPTGGSVTPASTGPSLPPTTPVPTATVLPCEAGSCPCTVFSVPCLWVFAIAAIIAGVIGLACWGWKGHRTRITDVKKGPGDCSPANVTIEARGGIHCSGIEADIPEIHFDVEGGIEETTSNGR